MRGCRVRLTLRDLKSLPVVTVSGRAIGRVIDVEIHPETQRIEAFHVRPHALLPGLLRGALIIDRRQVVRLTHEALIVEDVALAVDQAATDPHPSPSA